jgi:hypothetical protein
MVGHCEGIRRLVHVICVVNIHVDNKKDWHWSKIALRRITTALHDGHRSWTDYGLTGSDYGPEVRFEDMFDYRSGPKK